METEIQNRKEKIKNWLKDPYNLTLVGILFFAFAIRLYYFWLTKNQPLWWDESEYMAYAKNLAGIGDYDLGSIRLPTFSLLVSVFFRLGVVEPTMRFFVLFIPSIILIYSAYYLIREMYADKKIALISTLIFSVLWEHLFYSNRFHTENFSLIFEFLALIVLIKAYAKKEKFTFINHKYSLFFVILFSIIAVMFRPGNIIFFPGVFMFLIFLNGNLFFKNKKNTVYTALSLLALFVLFIIILNNFSIPIISLYYHPDKAVTWIHLTVFKGFFQPLNSQLPNLLYYSFLLGIVTVIFNFLTSFEKLKILKDDKGHLNFKSDLLNLLIIISVLIAFIFFLRPDSYEYRWFFPLLPGLLVFSSKGIIDFSSFIENKLSNKKIAVILIILISLFGFYTQLVRANTIIKAKVNSYEQVRASGLWIKENSVAGDSIISSSVPQHSYYSERKVYDYNMGGSESFYDEVIFLQKIAEIKPKYLVVSIFEPAYTPQWAFEWPNKNKDRVVPVQAYFADPQRTQPLLIVYEIKY